MAKQTQADNNLVGEVRTKYRYLQAKYAVRQERFRVLRDLYRLDFDSAFGWDPPDKEHPDDIRVIHSGPRKQTKHIKGLFVQHPPKVTVLSQRQNQEADRTTGMLEDFMHGVMQVNRQRNGDWYDDLVHQGLVTGWGVLFCSWNQDFEEEDEEGNYIGCPIVIKSVDPACVYYERGGVREQFQSVIYALDKRLVDVERQWGVKLSASRQSLTDPESPHSVDDMEVEYLDYWWWQRDKEGGRYQWNVYNAVIAGEDVVKRPTKMLGYNTLPYILWTSQPEPGWEAQDLGVGTLWDMVEPLKNWCRVANRKMRRLTYQADNVWIAEANSRFDADAWEGMDLDKTPGAITPVARGWRLRPLVDVTPGEDAERMLAIFDSQVNQAGLPVMAMGNLPGGDTQMSGITMETVLDAATTWLATDTTALTLALRRMVELIFSLCAALTPHGKRLVVSTVQPSNQARSSRPQLVRVALRRQDFVGYQVEVQIDTETLSDKLRKQQMGLQIKNMPLADRPYSNRSLDEIYFDVSDPDLEQERKYVEEIREMPEIKQRLALAEAVRRRLPLPQDLMRQYRQQREEVERVQEVMESPPGPQGLPPGPGGPGPGPAPGSGGQMIPGPQPGLVPPTGAMPIGGPMPVGNMPSPGGMPGPDLAALGGQLPPELVAQLAGVPGMPGPGQPSPEELLRRG